MFNEELDRKLIKLVKNNPVLYDHNDLNYVDFNAREVVWQMIGDEMKRPATDCKQRWINIRDVNKRLLRKCLTNPGGPTKPYKYHQDLTFMRQFYKDLNIDTTQRANEEQKDIESNDDDTADFHQNDEQVAQDSDDSETEKRRERKRKIKSKKSKGNQKKIKTEVDVDIVNRPETSFIDTSTAIQLDPKDPVDSFLVSIGSVLKTLTPYHLNLAKTKIFSIIQEHDLQNILDKNQDNTVE